MFSFDFDDIEQLQRAGQWELAGERLAVAARDVESAGAELLVLCTNTIHTVTDAVQDAVSIPLLHIVDPTARAIKDAGLSTVGLLATRYTMERDFYRGRLEYEHGLRALFPDEPGARRSTRSSTASSWSAWSATSRGGDGVHGRRLRGLIVVLWRAGLRICEALALTEADLDARRGSLLVRRGKGGRRREVGIDDWAFEQLAPWLQARVQLPVGPLFCVVTGPTRGRPWAAAAARTSCGAWVGRPACADASRPSAAARPRRPDGARGRAADRHPTPARPPRPRHHLHRPARGSTAPRSSTPSTPVAPLWSPSTAPSASEVRGSRAISASLGCPSRPYGAATGRLAWAHALLPADL
jgi:hypothetical protein